MPGYKKIKPCCECGRLIQERSKLCKSCSKRGNRNSEYSGKYPNHCIDCGKTIKNDKTVKRCLSCSKTGKLNPLWNNGISFEPYPHIFNKKLRKYIREKFKDTCQLCAKKKKGRNLCVHHIDYNKANCTESNFTLLCASCHSKVNTQRDYWVIFFQTLKTMIQ